MEVTSEARRSLLVTLRMILVALFVVLGALIVVVFAHAALSSGILVSVAQGLGVVFTVLAVASLVVGIDYAWRTYPVHRRAIIFVVGVTTLTLLAHLYIVGMPPAVTQGTVSGSVGEPFSDSKVSVNSSIAGQVLSVTVTVAACVPNNCHSIATLSLNGSGLAEGGFSPAPTLGSPLQPESTVTGSWTVTGSPSRLNLTYQYLSCAQNYGCIMDEVYYVPEAMGILAGQHCSTTAPNCHMEHPYLVPALIAAGMAVFGEYNAASWRIMPALLGTFTLPLLFVIAWKASGSKKVAYLSTILLGLDVMFFSQSSAALLDVPEVFFGVAAFFVYFANLKFWKLDKYVIAGILLGVAGLAKETAIFFALALVTYVVFFDEDPRKRRALNAAKVALVLALVFIAGLQAYDSTFASPSVPTFYQHISYMLSYGGSLNSGCPWACGWTGAAFGTYITPFDWVLYYSPVGYYLTSVTVCLNEVNGLCHGGQYTYVALAYYGITNLLETWTIYIWVPLAVYLLYRQFRKPQQSLDQFGFEASDASPHQLSGEVKFAGLALVWFLCTYLPYIPLFLGGRVTYPFYFIPAIPSVAMGCSYWVTRSWFPRWLMVIFVAMISVFFVIYFPYKGFFPDWLRAIIGH